MRGVVSKMKNELHEPGRPLGSCGPRGFLVIGGDLTPDLYLAYKIQDVSKISEIPEAFLSSQSAGPEIYLLRQVRCIMFFLCNATRIRYCAGTYLGGSHNNHNA